MSVFKKRETLTQNIAYMALMSAINVIIVLLSAWIPFLFFILVLVLPLTSLIVTYYCKKIYFPIYAVTTILLCIVSTIWNFADTIFYVVPSIFSGLIFGLFLEKKYPILITIIVSAIVQQCFTYLSIPIVKLIYERDIVYDLATVFSLKDYKYLEYVKHMFITFMSLTQMTLTIIVIIDEIKKFDIFPNDQDETTFVSIDIFILSLLVILFSFIYSEIVYIFVIYMLFLSVYPFIELIKRKSLAINIMLLITLVASFLLLVGLYSSLNKNKPLGLVSLSIFPFFISLITIMNNCLLNKRNKVRINNGK